MMRWLLWLLAGALLGGIVHLVAVLILPRTATQDAYSRLTPVAAVNAATALPPPSRPAPTCCHSPSRLLPLRSCSSTSIPVRPGSRCLSTPPTPRYRSTPA